MVYEQNQADKSHLAQIAAAAGSKCAQEQKAENSKQQQQQQQQRDRLGVFFQHAEARIQQMYNFGDERRRKSNREKNASTDQPGDLCSSSSGSIQAFLPSRA
jgi:hypothetical protein